jgi:hypothetical protein
MSFWSGTIAVLASSTQFLIIGALGLLIGAVFFSSRSSRGRSGGNDHPAGGDVYAGDDQHTYDASDCDSSSDSCDGGGDGGDGGGGDGGGD